MHKKQADNLLYAIASIHINCTMQIIFLKNTALCGFDCDYIIAQMFDKIYRDFTNIL